jgi:hypothetical protein
MLSLALDIDGARNESRKDFFHAYRNEIQTESRAARLEHC